MPNSERHLSYSSPIDEATSKSLSVSGDEFRTSMYDFFHVAYSLIDIRRQSANNIGLNSAQFSVLSMADALAPNSTPSEVAKALHVTNAFVTIESAKLESLGLIEKQTNPQDARSVLLLLTELGLEKFNEAYAELRRMNAMLFADFDPEDFLLLNKIMGKLGKSTDEIMSTKQFSRPQRLSGVA